MCGNASNHTNKTWDIQRVPSHTAIDERTQQWCNKVVGLMVLGGHHDAAQINWVSKWQIETTSSPKKKRLIPWKGTFKTRKNNNRPIHILSHCYSVARDILLISFIHQLAVRIVFEHRRFLHIILRIHFVSIYMSDFIAPIPQPVWVWAQW